MLVSHNSLAPFALLLIGWSWLPSQASASQPSTSEVVRIEGIKNEAGHKNLRRYYTAEDGQRVRLYRGKAKGYLELSELKRGFDLGPSLKFVKRNV